MQVVIEFLPNGKYPQLPKAPLTLPLSASLVEVLQARIPAPVSELEVGVMRLILEDMRESNYLNNKEYILKATTEVRNQRLSIMDNDFVDGCINPCRACVPGATPSACEPTSLLFPVPDVVLQPGQIAFARNEVEAYGIGMGDEFGNPIPDISFITYSYLEDMLAFEYLLAGISAPTDPVVMARHRAWLLSVLLISPNNGSRRLDDFTVTFEEDTQYPFIKRVQMIEGRPADEFGVAPDFPLEINSGDFIVNRPNSFNLYPSDIDIEFFNTHFPSFPGVAESTAVVDWIDEMFVTQREIKSCSTFVNTGV